MMDVKGINELLERYRNGQCTAEEKTALEDWFDAQAAGGNWDWSEQERKATERRIKINIDQKLSEKKSNWPMLLRVAAIVFVLLSTAIILRNDIRDLADPVVLLEKSVGDGERLDLTLPDGSKVFLNAGSRLRYPNRFTKGKRQVYLVEGEAYFDISHDPSNPFIVTSKHINTRVLGTAFNIKAYRYLSNLQVAVTRGKVRVSDQSGTKAVSLLPNQQITVDNQSGRMTKQQVDAQAVISWQRGDFIFNNDRLVDVCAVLSKKYKLNFYFRQKEIQDYRITAGFVSKDRIDDILSILANANSLAYERQGLKVIFKKQLK